MASSKRRRGLQFDPDQQRAIEHVGGPMLVVAGAGTGKTTVLTRRIANLISQGHARPDEILAITYTVNAAAEMRQRLANELSKSAVTKLQVETFHAYCNGFLARAGKTFQVLDDQQLWIFLRRRIRELRLNYFVRAANTATFLSDLTDFIRRCHDELVGPQEYAEYVRHLERGEFPLPRVTKSKDADEISDEEVLGRCREIAFVFETVERMLRERNFGLFGHMIIGAHDLLTHHQSLLGRERSRLRFILVDEFQDANFAQIKVLEKIAGASGNVFAVGDPDQGIYRFRGASSDAFELFQKHFLNSKLVVLSKSRRSTTPILKVASALIAQNPDFDLQLEGARYQRAPLISARDEEDQGQASRRPPVEVVLSEGTIMEASDLAAALKEKRNRMHSSWQDFAILYRSHFHRDEVAGQLAREQIPFSIEGFDVSDAPEVRDLLACLGAVVSGDDNASLLRVAALPQFEIDPGELRKAIVELPRESRGSVAAVLPVIRGGREVLEAISSARAAGENQKVRATLLTLLRHFQLAHNGAIEALLKFASAWEASPITENGSPAEFLEYITYFREAKGIIPLASSVEMDSVKLMTIHSAKGLEFDNVFIVRAIKTCFPANFREKLIDLPRELCKSNLSDVDEKNAHDQEERRLFYVGVTRARDSLTLCSPYGRGRNDRTPAGFLRELLKDRTLNESLRQRNCRGFQTSIFAEEAQALSPVAEWVTLPPATNLATTVSASSLQRYETCPLQFKLDREWRIPADASAAMQYGASMHRVLRSYYQSVSQARPLSEDEVLEEFRQDLAAQNIADRYQHDLYEHQGISQLKEFLAGTLLVQPDVLHTEERFSVKIGETNLAGRIDRIDRGTGGGVVITDYKTGKPQNQEAADKSLQLSLYALAAREKWGYRAERLVLHNLEGNAQVTTTRSESELQDARLKVEDIAAKIAGGKFEPKPGSYCYSCAYRALCPRTEKRVPESPIAEAMQRN